jgi:hypothetical protein
MQTLVFNTTTKTVKLYKGEAEKTELLYNLDNIPTVKPGSDGYYEVMQKTSDEKTIPVLRLPVASTNMSIVK